MPNPRQIREVAEAIRGRGKVGRSPVFRWLRENYSHLALEKSGKSDWHAVIDALHKEGIRGRNGEDLKPDNVRKIWSRVVADMKARPASPASPVQRPAPSAASGYVHSSKRFTKE